MIRGGLVVRGSGITREDIVVVDGKIVENDGSYADPDIGRIIDASGHFVLPGIVDAHNHPVNADRIETFSLSAAHGGVTTVVPFIQNMRRQGIEGTVVDMIHEFMDEAAADSYLDYAIHAILLGDDDVEDQVPKLMDMGVISLQDVHDLPETRHDDAGRPDAQSDGDGGCRWRDRHGPRRKRLLHRSPRRTVD